MRRIILSFIALLVFIPIYINASVYANFKVSQENTTKYIKNFKNYQWFIDPTTKYLYEGNILKTLSGFSKGGFVNQFEYNASLFSGKSYLSNVMKYWTMTSNGASSYSVVGNNIIATSEATKELGSRITEYIRKKAKVTGSGTYTDPWEFVDPDFETKLTFSNPQISGSSGVTGDKIAGYGDTITYIVELTNNGAEAAKITLNEIKLQDSIGTKVNKTSVAQLYTTTNGVVSNASSANAVIAMNALLSENGYTFVLEPGQTITLKYNVTVIGNAGETIDNQVIYTVDGLQPKANDAVTVYIEKKLQYIKVADNGANIVLSIDDSGSMSTPKMNSLKKAAKAFVDILMVRDGHNDNNQLCLVSMNRNLSGSNRYICVSDTVSVNTIISKIDALYGNGMTPYNTALKNSYKAIDQIYNQNNLNNNYLIFFSDGLPNGGSYTNDRNNIINYHDTKIYTIGFGLSVNDSLLDSEGGVCSGNNLSGAAKILNELATPCDGANTYSYFDGKKLNIEEVFTNIANKIGQATGQTVRGVINVSTCIDPARNLVFDITKKDKSKYRVIKTFAQALNENYLIFNKSANVYEINVKLFEPTDEVAVSFYMKKGCVDDD